jgi:hypothetical protein
MKPARILLPAATGILGLLLGLALAPAIRKPGEEIAAISAASLPQTAKSSELIPDDPKTNHRTRARERAEDKKPKEPRVSIPFKTMVGILKERDFKYASRFDSLGRPMESALRLLGATDREREEVMGLVKQSEAEILAAEKSNCKLGEVTAERIHIDMSGMRGPAAEITRRTQDGIRAALPPDLAEGLVSSIDWENYYPAISTSFLEITRSTSGTLTAWQRINGGGSGRGLGRDFKDDGTPLPADLVFGNQRFDDRWAPFLKGVTILPKDEE